MMKTNVMKMRVNDVTSNEFKSAEVHLVSEIDFEHLNPLELLQSGGVKKSVMFLRNLGDDATIKQVTNKLLNQVINVCEYRFEVGELFPGKTSIIQTVITEDGEKTVSTFSQLVQTMPCIEGFEASKDDIEAVKSTLIAQTERRISNGVYELK